MLTPLLVPADDSLYIESYKMYIVLVYCPYRYAVIFYIYMQCTHLYKALSYGDIAILITLLVLINT